MAYVPIRPTPALLPRIARHPAAWYDQDGEPLLAPEAYARAKRTFDILVTLCVAPLVLVLVLLCIAAIRIDSRGPAFFPQSRTGRGGHRFRMMKLRTMVQNAEDLKRQVMHLNELPYPDFKIAADPRITRLGRILRKTSLDELPQF